MPLAPTLSTGCICLSEGGTYIPRHSTGLSKTYSANWKGTNGFGGTAIGDVTSITSQTECVRLEFHLSYQHLKGYLLLCSGVQGRPGNKHGDDHVTVQHSSPPVVGSDGDSVEEGGNAMPRAEPYGIAVITHRDPIL